MKKKLTLILSILMLGNLITKGQVIISQIYEGKSYNKFIEITNMGTTSVDLASPQLTIKLFSNKTEIGTNTPTYTLALTGTLNPGQSKLYRHPNATRPAYALTYTPGDTSAVTNFNGQGSSSAPTASTDIIALYNETTLSDVFGWNVFQYVDKSYIRNGSVVLPNATFTETEWTFVDTANVNTAAANTPEYLGYHGIGSTEPTISITYPANNATVYTADVNITFATGNFVVGTDGNIQYTVDGGTAAIHTSSSSISVTSLANGSHTVVLTLVDMSNNPLSPNVADTVTFTVNLSGPTVTPIYDIQYTIASPADSPLNNQSVTTTGIVTASFASGYFIQDGTSGWNGLYVYDNTHTPALGDEIIITGTVSEYYNYTEFKTITYYAVTSQGNALPIPIELTNTTVKDEQYEGMLVKIIDGTCTYVHTSGWWKEIQGTSTDTLEIGKLMYPYTAAVVGTHYDITGLVNYSFSNFIVEPRDANDIVIHTGITENKLNIISIYPNPVKNNLFIDNMNGIEKIRISNLLGETIESINITNNNINVNTENLSKGIYFITLFNNKGISETRKFSKE